jgi:hypothetical protein
LSLWTTKDLGGSVPGWKHTEDAKQRISLATSASLKEHWRTPHGQDVLLRRRENRLRDSAIPRCDDRIASWRARRDSLEAELAGIDWSSVDCAVRWLKELHLHAAGEPAAEAAICPAPLCDE